MRGRVCVIGAGLLMLTGCGGGDATFTMPAPTVAVTDLPASAAGGACQLLDFAVIEEVTGARFDISAASEHKKTQTCVVQAEAASRPDLSLSVTETSVSSATFADEMVPKGAKAVKGLGKSAYQLIRAPGKAQGAGTEVGWLTDGRAVCLRYTFAAGEDEAVAGAFAPKLIALAKKIEVAQKP